MTDPTWIDDTIRTAHIRPHINDLPAAVGQVVAASLHYATAARLANKLPADKPVVLTVPDDIRLKPLFEAAAGTLAVHHITLDWDLHNYWRIPRTDVQDVPATVSRHVHQVYDGRWGVVINGSLGPLANAHQTAAELLAAAAECDRRNGIAAAPPIGTLGRRAYTDRHCRSVYEEDEHDWPWVCGLQVGHDGLCDSGMTDQGSRQWPRPGAAS